MNNSIKSIKELMDEIPDEEFLQLHRTVEKGIGPTIEEFYTNVLYEKYRGKCKEYAEKLIEKNPELILVRGYYNCPFWGVQQHWWCKQPDGTIVDPTVKQFPSYQLALNHPEDFYEEFDGYINCDECGKRVKEEDARFDSRYAFCSTKCNMRFVGL